MSTHISAECQSAYSQLCRLRQIVQSPVHWCQNNHHPGVVSGLLQWSSVWCCWWSITSVQHTSTSSCAPESRTILRQSCGNFTGCWFASAYLYISLLWVRRVTAIISSVVDYTTVINELVCRIVCCRNGDHIHTNFRDMYLHLRSNGYFIEVLGMFYFFQLYAHWV